MSNDLMSNDKEEQNMNEYIAQKQAEEKKRLEDAIAVRQRKQDQIDRDAKLVAESEKQFTERRKTDLRRVLFYGLDPETSKNLEELLNLSSQLANIGSQYDPSNRRKIELEAKIDILKGKITEAGRNLGDVTFVKKTYYQSVEKDYFLFPDNQGAYHLFAGNLGAFRTTIESLETNEKGLPLKMFKQDRICTTPEIPIIDYQTIKIKEVADPQTPKYKPSKRIFPEGYKGEQEEQPKARTSDSRKGVSLFGHRNEQ